MAARFDAFISYSRAASSTLAVELRNGIERFAKPWYRLRSSRVFLDDASMSANTGLWSTIERGLTEADWFILLCSPKSAASQYVTNEITWWLEHKTSDRILLVLDEGEILWDAAGHDFDWERASAVNPALSKAFAEEPRWVDLSWFEQEGSLRAADPRFPERVADLAAAVRGIERDELIGENVRARRRALRLLRGGVIALSGLLVASLVATVIAVVNGNAAAEQARIALARQLAAQAITLSETDLQLASLLAVEANRLNDDVQTRAALFRLASASPYLVKTLDVGAEVASTALSPDGVVLTGDADGQVELWPEGHAQLILELPDRVQNVAMSADQQVIGGVTTAVAAVAAAGRGEQLDMQAAGWEGGDLNLISVSPDGRYVVVGDQNLAVSVFEEIGGGYQPLGTVQFGGEIGWTDSGFTVMDGMGEWARVSLPDLAIVDSGWHTIPMGAYGGAVSADGGTLAGQTELGVNYVIWDADSAGGDAPDRIVTSQVSGALDMALDEHGTRFAALVEGAIYVSEVRDVAALPEPPLVLDGAGDVTASTLAFSGDRLVNGTGRYALVWDLTQNGRITTEVEAQVADTCTACGPPIVRPNADGSRVITTDVTAGTTYVTDVATGETLDLRDPDGGGYSGASWFGDDRIIVYTSTAGGLRVLSGADFATADLTVPVALGPDGAIALVIRGDGSDQGTATVLDSSGLVQTVDLGSGRPVASTEALHEVWDTQAPASFDIAPDQSTAMVNFLGARSGYVDIVDDRLIYQAERLDGAAFDAASGFHVFAKGSEWLVAPGDGSLGPAHPAALEYSPPPALSPDGQVVATGGQTGTVSLLTLDGRGSVFGRVEVPVESRRFAAYAFTPDGTAMITAIQSMEGLGRPATIRTLDLRTDAWADSACALAGRELTAAEWSAYVGTTPPADLRCSR